MNGLPCEFFAVLAGIALVSILACIHLQSGQNMLEAWAEKQGCQLLEAEYAAFPLRGPYIWASRNQAVYRIKVQFSGGSMRWCWLCCGTPFFGVAVNVIDVKWDS